VPVLYFSIWFQQHNFMKRKLLNKKCVTKIMVQNRHKLLCWTDSTGIIVIYNTTGINQFKNKKCVFWFSLQLLSKTFLILRRILQDIIIKVCMSSRKVPTMPVRFEWILIFLTDFWKINIKFQKNPLSGIWVVPRKWTDRHDEANSQLL